jgi:hypothetical protein
LAVAAVAAVGAWAATRTSTTPPPGGAHGAQPAPGTVGSGPAGPEPGPTPSTTAPLGAPGVPTAALTAITAWETANGPAAGTWRISSAQVSTVEPSYVLFHVGPAAGYESRVQGGYGFAQESAGTWQVIGFGSAEVGCPGGGGSAPVVPVPVLIGFGLGCPPSD